MVYLIIGEMMKSIAINEEMHARIKNLSNITGKKIYRLILEAIEYLEELYIRRESNE